MIDIKGYEGLYAITSCGRVWSYYTNKFLTPSTHGNQGRGKYYYVSLYKNHKPKAHDIHRLVAEAYIPNPNNLPEVNHIDEDKSHNWVSNLEWCTHKQNCNHGTKNDWCKTRVRCVETGETFDSIMAAEIHEKGRFTGALNHCLKGESKTFNKKHWEVI